MNKLCNFYNKLKFKRIKARRAEKEVGWPLMIGLIRR